jgi:predicted nucleotidyltransferase
VNVEELVALLGRALSADARLSYALLFGSAATRGPQLADDIDIAVSARAPLGLLDRMRLATDLERVVGKAVDVVDLDEASTLLRREVLRDGRPLVVNDAAAFLGFKASVPIEWADLEPYFERESAGLAKALEETRWSKSSSSATRSDG